MAPGNRFPVWVPAALLLLLLGVVVLSLEWRRLRRENLKLDDRLRATHSEAVTAAREVAALRRQLEIEHATLQKSVSVARLICSIEATATITGLHFLESEAEAGPIGLGTVATLATAEGESYRFINKDLVGWYEPSTGSLKLEYEPESPHEILGKPIQLLDRFTTLTVNYGPVFRLATIHGGDDMSLHFELRTNGTTLTKVQGKLSRTLLDQGPLTYNFAAEFSNLSRRYANWLGVRDTSLVAPH